MAALSPPQAFLVAKGREDGMTGFGFRSCSLAPQSYVDPKSLKKSVR
ncbi:MAG: hypothetical protein AAF562_11320 [Pseudomonadota bacterium]